MPASTPLRPLVDALEQMSALDSVAKTVGKTVRDLIGRGEIKDAISGTWFGARRGGARGRGAVLALAGTAVMTVGGYLGGHMSYTRGVGPNQTAFDPGPDDWTAVGDGQAFPNGEPRAAIAQDTPVLLLRH